MSNQAIGMLETRGMVGLVTAGDAMCKAANVAMIGTIEIGGGYATTVVKGEVGNVKAAVEAGLATLRAVGAEVIASHVIPQPTDLVMSIVEKKI
jgi:ethanolamine utilization protein EutM